MWVWCVVLRNIARSLADQSPTSSLESYFLLHVICLISLEIMGKFLLLSEKFLKLLVLVMKVMVPNHKIEIVYKIKIGTFNSFPYHCKISSFPIPFDHNKKKVYSFLYKFYKSFHEHSSPKKYFYQVDNCNESSKR